MKKPKEALPGQSQLLRIFSSLEATKRAQLIAFAQFLAQPDGHDTVEDTPVPMAFEPVAIPRPAEETVVAAMQRLSQTYPMRNKDKLLHQAADLMSAHVLQGRAAVAVIDELELVFAQAYQADAIAAGASLCD